ncbi:MAG: AraC family transcriptional regulator [Rikenellaceae bacterium]|nr:AraC family transcriptional regulator [Rikenellaceae bacterium]
METDPIRQLHRKRINRVIDHIHAHLDRKLTVDELASVAGLSPYHFHRTFRALVGEPVARYVMRKRLERAGSLLLGDPSAPVSDIAYACGFSSPSVFSRNFRRCFGMSAETFRRTNCHAQSKNRQASGKRDPQDRSYSRYLCRHKTVKTGDTTMDCTFEIKELPALSIAYCRHVGPFDQMESAFSQLMQWAYPRGLLDAPGLQLLSVYHDHPGITAPDKLTSDAGMVVPPDTRAEGCIGRYDIAPGRFAVGRFEIGMDEFREAWDAMFALIAEHGCQCAEGPHYELYRNNRDEHPGRKWIVDICIPVRPL